MAKENKKRKRYVVFYLDVMHRKFIHPLVLECRLCAKSRIGALIKFHQKHHYIKVVGCLKESEVLKYVKEN